jgi:hypothetical protein
MLCFCYEVLVFLKNSVRKFDELQPFDSKWWRIWLRKKKSFKKKIF